MNPYSAWKFYYDMKVENPPTTSGFQATFVLQFLPGMRADFRDIRFTDKNGNKLYHFLDSYTAFETAKFFIKLPANETKLLMYYGNGAAVSESSGSDVFELFDEFVSLNSSVWKLIQGSASILNGVLSLSHPNNNTVIESYQTFPVGSYIEAKAYHAATNEFKLGFRSITSLKAAAWFGQYIVNYDHKYTHDGTSGTWISDGVNRDGSSYYIYGVVNLAEGPRFYIDGTYRGSVTSTNPGPIALPIQFYSERNSGNVGIDWVRVRKYLANEPVITLGYKHIQNNNGFLQKHDYFYDSFALEITTSHHIKKYFYDSFALEITTGIMIGQPSVFSDSVDLELYEVNVSRKHRKELRDFSLISCAISKSIEDTYIQLSAEFEDDTVPGDGATVKYFAHDPFDDLENFPLYTADGYPVYTDDGYQVFTTEVIRGYPLYTSDGYQVFTNDGFPVYTGDLIIPEVGHLLFMGKVVSTTPTLSYLGNTVSMQAADLSLNLTAQRVPWNYQVISLDDGFSTWDQWIAALLDTEKTGVQAGNIVDPGTPSKQFVFKPKTSRLEAISEISGYIGCVLNIKLNVTDIDYRKEGVPYLYAVHAANIDQRTGGLDLPSPIEFSWTDLSIVDQPTVTGEQDEKYNKVIVHGVHSDSGETTVAAAYTPAVHLGEENAREFVFEDNAISEKGSTAEIEAIKWLLYFTSPRATVSMKFLNRYDLELYQRIRFGEGFSKELRNLTISSQLPYVVAYDPRDEASTTHTVDVSGVPRPSWLRISEIKYHSAETEETCEIKAITDFIYSSADPAVLAPYSTYIAPGYLKPVSDDTVSTVQSIVTDTIEKQLTPELCTVLSKDEVNKTMLVQTQSGKLVTVRYG